MGDIDMAIEFILPVIERHVIFRRVLLRKEKMLSGSAYNEQVKQSRERLIASLRQAMRDAEQVPAKAKVTA